MNFWFPDYLEALLADQRAQKLGKVELTSGGNIAVGIVALDQSHALLPQQTGSSSEVAAFRDDETSEKAVSDLNMHLMPLITWAHTGS